MPPFCFGVKGWSRLFFGDDFDGVDLFLLLGVVVDDTFDDSDGCLCLFFIEPVDLRLLALFNSCLLFEVCWYEDARGLLDLLDEDLTFATEDENLAGSLKSDKIL